MENGMSAHYRASHTAVGKGEQYQAVYETSPWLRYSWGRERTALRAALGEHALHRGRYLDFACGTGRVLSFVGAMFEAAVGVDVSESMLAVARTTCPYEAINADLTVQTVFESATFDLITAFRFFPNAEPALRQDAMQVLSGLLAADGVLIFNNHQNAASSVVRAHRALRRTIPWTPLAHAEVERLVTSARLRIVDTYRIGVLPATERRMIAPPWVHDVADAIARRIPSAGCLFQDVLYVCKHAS
jgi:SAM-dependent methyltransferase